MAILHDHRTFNNSIESSASIVRYSYRTIDIKRSISLAKRQFLKGPSLTHPNMIEGLILLLNTILSSNITLIHINVYP
jgi:hypothetical protein